MASAAILWTVLGIVLLGLLALPLKEFIMYLISVNSRRHYSCPQCGERIMMEHGTASICSACGAALVEDPRRGPGG
ncbi:hypothetical protein KDL44_14785 [bacterium]|nr:hypothetical protein [bacterium]